MAEIGNIPRNWLAGPANLLGKARELAYALTGAKSGPVQFSGDVLNQLLGKAPEVLESASYGFPPTRGTGYATQVDPGVLDVAGLLPLPGPGTMAAAGKGLLAKLASMGGGLAGVMTYHGTPHKIAKYDLSKVGTGQGAQSYGRGIYLAENPDTGRSYRDILGSEGVQYPSGETIKRESSTDQSAAQQALRYAGYAGWGHKAPDPIQTAIEHITDLPGLVKNPEGALKWLRHWKEAGAEYTKFGNLYKQDLPDEALPRMLQWDKPLNKQSETVRRALQSAPFETQGIGDIDVPNLIDMAATYAGGTGRASGASPQGGAELLRALGIPGSSYLDAGSRSAGSGTMNHVIWDQVLLDLLKPELTK